MYIAHLSDLHLNARHKPESIYTAENLIEYALCNGADHIVITGDISHNADPHDYHILRSLLYKYDLLTSDKTSLTIGNHDIFGGITFIDELESFPKRCRNTDFDEKIKVFTAIFNELFQGTVKFNERSPFPYVKELGESILIGVNSVSNYSLISNPLASNGKVSTEEFIHISQILRNPIWAHKKKLVLIHHHFQPFHARLMKKTGRVWKFMEKHTMKLYGKNGLINLFSEQKVDLVLHGHDHINIGYILGGVSYLNGGGSVEYAKEGKFKINFIRIAEDGISVKMESPLLPVRSYIPAHDWQVNELAFVY
jgi:3',5'-cyclic AMP phosphodiesterase CpdA